MVNLTQYLCNLSHHLNFPCQWCLPIDLDSTPQSLSFYLSSQGQLFLFGPRIFTIKLPSWVRLDWLCKEDLLLYLFFGFLCSVIPFELLFLKARINKCLLAFIKQEEAGSLKESRSLYFLLFWHFCICKEI